jgi:putative membrane protein
MHGCGAGMMGGAMHSGVFGMIALGPILFIVLLGLTVYLLVRYINKKNKIVDQPLMLLRERFAKGEIDEEEYKAKSKVLKE